MITRRRCLALGLAGMTIPRSALAQTPERLARIGVLVPAARELFDHRFIGFTRGLRELGYVEGKTVAFEHRYADGRAERLAMMAAELVRAKVDLIFTAAAEGVLAAKAATRTIPIVFGTVQDPVAEGIVETLARPGGNATGLSAVAPELSSKRLGLLKETIPGIVRVAHLWAPLSRGTGERLSATQAAAQALGLQIQSVEVRPPTQNLAGALQAALRGRAQGLTTAPDPLLNSGRSEIVGFAITHRLPGMYAAPEFTAGGGLMSYAPDYLELWRRAAGYADRIFKGARPADLPVEQPSKFLFTINVKAAKQIGLTIPPGVLARADAIIEEG